MNKRFPPQSLQEAVYAAAAFFDVFDRPLQRRDFQDYVLGVETREDEIDAFLAKDARLGVRDEHFFLPGRAHLVRVRENRDAISDLYWKRVWKYTPLLQAVPFLRAVAVCNTLAFDNCTSESDIDLFIITRARRIFTARVLSGLLLHLFGVRRHGDKVAGRFCLSFYVAEDGMNLEEMQHDNDVYLYYWMKSLEFVYRENDRIYKKFFQKNQWFLQHVPDGMGTMDASKQRPVLRAIAAVAEFLLGGFVGDWLEHWLEKKHLSRFEANREKLGKESDVVVSRKMLKFHNIDRRADYNQQFFERYNALL